MVRWVVVAVANAIVFNRKQKTCTLNYTGYWTRMEKGGVRFQLVGTHLQSQHKDVLDLSYRRGLAPFRFSRDFRGIFGELGFVVLGDGCGYFAVNALPVWMLG